jgi:uncharacterized protein YjiS (DUF1127 family)
MTIMFDAIALAAGVAGPSDHRPVHPASVQTHRPGPTGRFIRNVLADIGGAVPLHPFEGFRRWQKRRKAIVELGALDSRLLQDLGIHRSQIRDVVNAQLQAGVRTL